MTDRNSSITSPSPLTGSSPPEIRMQKLCQSFEGRKVIADLDLEVRPGEFLVILGPSGCGKSTLLRLVAGLTKPVSGQLILNPPHPGIGFVFQDASLLPWRTALGYVLLPLELDGMDLTQAREEALTLLQDVGLEGFGDYYPDTLSGGMRMRVSIARALAGNPSLLLLDEPFAALDEVTRSRLDRHLGELTRQRGTTTLFVTHSIQEALVLADRIVVLSPTGGQVVFQKAVPFDWPRTPQHRQSSEWQDWTRHLAECLDPSGAEA